MVPLLRNGKSGHMRGMTISEGLFNRINGEFVLQNCCHIIRVAAGEAGHT